MKKLFSKKQILTIPNLLSLFRFVLIPIIIWLYCVREEYGLTVLMILLSGATDIVDGFIARRFNMTSDIGKILDPVADKTTQIAVIVCLAFRYVMMRGLAVIFAIKEIILMAMGCAVILKKDEVNSAKWYGKMNTVVLYTVMMVLILYVDIPLAAANTLIGICIAVMMFSFIMYVMFYIERLRNNGR